MNAKKLLLTTAAVVTVAITCGASAQAGVPFWARTFHGTRITIPECAQVAQQAIQSVVGGPLPTLTRLDGNNTEVRGFSANDGIFVYCTASPVLACPGQPQADVTILTFSPVNDAITTLNRVNTAFGNPIAFDCGP